MSDVEGTIPVPEHLTLPVVRLTSYLKSQLGLHGADPPFVRCFEHGQSNPTYFVHYGGQNMVLRKKPPGKLLPSAHAVDREYRVMKAVASQGVPVPKMFAYGEDDSILGTPFYLMEYLPGRVFTNNIPTAMTPTKRTQIYEKAIDVLCKIHSVDITKAGLDNFGKHGKYIERSFNRWAKQYEASKTKDMPTMNKLMEWISQRLPTDEKVTLVHGDYRLDNLIFDFNHAEVLGVIDWELSTIGDPIADLATFCRVWYQPRDLFPGLQGFDGVNLKELGIPSAQELIGLYCKKMNIHPIENWDFYMAFIFFRNAAIMQGVYKRAISGQSTNPHSASFGDLAEVMANIGWRIASKSNLQPTRELSLEPPSTDFNSHSSRRSYGNSTRTMMSYISRPLAVETATHATVGQMPVTVEGLPPRVQDLYRRVEKFIQEYIIPLELEMYLHLMSPNKWQVLPRVEELKAMARSQGLWNLFLPLESDPDMKYGAGLTNTEYAFMCEMFGKYPLASEIFNCSAPDTGNMEVLVRYGTEEQKKKWLIPLLNGEIRSCFGMTEPNVASSDATNIQSSIRREGDHYIINGHKWWTSGAMHPKCKVCVFMGKTNPDGPRHKQQSMILVPMDAPGVKIVRSLPVFGYHHAPGGHAEVLFENVRVPLSNILLREGGGFEIAQGRLGPGRIHHCMRMVGVAERALEYMIDRTQNRIAFGKPLAAQGTIQTEVAQSRIEIEQIRLLVLKAAYLMDLYGNKVAAPEIAMIKVAAPRAVLGIIDRSIQAHGGAGVSDDFPLAALFAQVRTLRLADGPDEVHARAVGKMEYAKYVLSKM